MPKAAKDQASDRAPASSPTCVLLSPSSGWTNGISTFSAWRSKKTMPKLRLSRPTSQAW